jgi:hypothetical protein
MIKKDEQKMQIRHLMIQIVEYYDIFLTFLALIKIEEIDINSNQDFSIIKFE